MYHKNIKKIRKENGMSQRELADKIYISQSYVSELEDGKHDATVAVLIMVCLGLNKSPNELLDWDNLKSTNIDYIRNYLNNNKEEL